MCEWLKKIFGFKCSCKHCHCGEEQKVEPTVESTPIAPVATPEASTEEHTENL